MQKKILLLTLASISLGLIFACSSTKSTQTVPPKTNFSKPQQKTSSSRDLVVVATNDFHGRVFYKANQNLGYARLASFVQNVRELNKNVLFLDAGGTFSGTPFMDYTKGILAVKLLNQMGLGALTLGTTDFDYTQAQLMSLSHMASFPMLAANVSLPGQYKKMVTPYLIKNYNGFKVAVFGLLTPQAKTLAYPQGIKNVKIDDPVQTAKKMVRYLKNTKKVDFVIALTHLGLGAPLKNQWQSTALTHIPGLNLVIDGNTHKVLPSGVLRGHTLVTQAGGFGNAVSVIHIHFNMKNSRSSVTPYVYSVRQIANHFPAQQAANNLISSFWKGFATYKKHVLGQTSKTLIGTPNVVNLRETNLGDLLADAVCHVSHAQLAIINSGELQDNIFKGAVTIGDVLKAIPSNNYIVVKKLTGAQVLSVLEYGVSYTPNASNVFPQISGFKLYYYPQANSGEKVHKVVLHDGHSLNLTKIYRVALVKNMNSNTNSYNIMFRAQTHGTYHLVSEALISFLYTHMIHPNNLNHRIISEKRHVQQKPRPVMQEK